MHAPRLPGQADQKLSADQPAAQLLPVSPLLPVSALVFEVSGVFYDDTPWPRWLLMLLTRMGLHTQFEAFYRVWRRDHERDVVCGRRPYWTVLREFLLAAGLSPAQVDEIEAAGHVKRRQFEEDVRAFPGVAAVLTSLHNHGVRLAVLSNTSQAADALRARLVRLGLRQPFDAVVTSCDLQSAKPDQACYRAVLERLQLAADQTALVSHDAADLAGARTCGMQTLAIHYDNNALADLFLDRFDDLLTSIPYHSHKLLAG